MATLMKFNWDTGKLDFVVDPDNPGISHADLDDLVAPADDHTQYALLAGRAGGQTLIGGTLTTQALTLQDNAVDANALVFAGGVLYPSVTDSIDLGQLANTFETVWLEGGASKRIIQVPNATERSAYTSYIMELGGGFYGIGLGGGDFTFEFASAVAGGENLLTFDLGAVYFSGGPTLSNDFVILCDNGLDTHRFIAKFGGWTNPEYGWALDRIVGTGENLSKTLFFDNQEPVSDFRRSIDFRINSVNVLTIENLTQGIHGTYTVDFPLQHVTAPNSGLMINGFMALSGSTLFNVLDILTIQPQNPVSANVGGILAIRPSGTSDITASLCTNDPSTAVYGTFENSLSNDIARLAVWEFGGGTGPTELRIGEMASAFFGVGNFGNLTTIPFYFNNLVEMEIQPDTVVFNNGAVDTQLDWATSGELGLQVATNDIIRISATQARVLQDLVIPSDTKSLFLGASLDASIIYNGTVLVIDSSLQNPSDIDIDCGTEKTIRLVETVWDDLRIPVAATGKAVNAPTLGPFLGAGSIQAYRFTGTGVQQEEVFASAQLPHRYKEGTDILMHVHWSPTDGNAGNVVWQMEYTWVNINGVFPAATTIVAIDAAAGTAWTHQVAPFAAIDGTGKLISSVLMMRIYRDPAHGSDTYGFDAAGISLDLHFEVDTMGSRQEFIK